jgi:hypothetical protein
MASTAPAAVASAQHHRFAAVLWAGGRTNRSPTNALVVLGAVLLGISAGIHAHLWDTGYRHIATIGVLFGLQAVSGLVVAVAVVAWRRVGTSLLGAGFAASTLVGFLLSVNGGLFGFEDSWAAPDATLAFGVELGALVVLAAAAALSWRDWRRSTS